MANKHIEINEKKEYYEDFRSKELLKRCKFDKRVKVKTEVIDWDLDICRRIYEGGFTIDDIRCEFLLYSSGGILIPDIEELTKDKEQQEIFEVVVRYLHNRFVEDYQPRLLELREKFLDGRATVYINEFVDINYKIDNRKQIDSLNSYIDTRIFYENEDITCVFDKYRLNYIAEDITAKSFKDYLQQHVFYLMYYVITSISKKDFNVDEVLVEYYAKRIEAEYSKIRLEIDVYNLYLEKNYQ